MNRTLLVGLPLFALLALVLLATALRPDLDLVVAALFLDRPGHFVGDTPPGIALRYALWAAPFALLLALLLASLAARLGLIRHAPRPRSLLFLVACMLVSPALTVHFGLKEVSHRPRPWTVTDFGGPDAFRPWNRFDGACRHDCAFPSGETALAAWTLAPASLAPPAWRVAALAAALAFTALTGGWRMALGAHFLSDVAAACLISMMSVLACRHLLRIGPTGDQHRAELVGRRHLGRFAELQGAEVAKPEQAGGQA